MNIGFIGYGEVGHQMSEGLSQYDVDNIFAFDTDQIGAKSKQLSDMTKLTYLDTSEELVSHALDILFVAVPANITKEVWTEIVELLDDNVILVDLTTASAEEKQEINSMYEDHGKSIIDAAILGALKVYQHRVPMLISGTNGSKFKRIGNSLDMNIDFLNENVGDATNFKFVRSIYTKGLSALLYEVLDTAETLGIKEEIYDSITTTMNKDSFGEIVNRYIKSNVSHSKRREKEMENVINFMESNDIEPSMTNGTKKTLELISKTNLKEKLNEIDYDWKDVIEHYNDRSPVSGG